MKQEYILAIAGATGGILTTLIATIPEYIRVRRESKEQSFENVKAVYSGAFAYLDEMEAFYLTRYSSHDPGRTALIREQAIHKIRVWRPILFKAAEIMDECYKKDKSHDLSSCNKLHNVFQGVLTEGLQAYVGWHRLDRVLSVYGVEYNEEDKDTMDVFIKCFQKWHSPREEMVRVGIQDISTSKVSSNCIAKTWDILLVFQLAFLNMKLDLEKTENELNGSLTGKKFLGLTIGPCSKEV